tara:strand:+ start:1083 stop:1337 length:255 start_codon:yes stop_codon:yes gene_type:complete
MDLGNQQLLDILISILGTAMLGLIGFVWKTSHRVSEHEKTIESLREMQRKNSDETQRDIDYLMSKVEKQGDRMMSIARDIPKGK